MDFIKRLGYRKLLSLLAGAVILPLLVLAVAFNLVGGRQTLVKKAAEEELTVASGEMKPEFAKGEIIVKLRTPNTELKVKEEKQTAGVSFDTKSVEFQDLDAASAPSVIQSLDQKYKIKKIDKVFKGAETPEKELTKIKQTFSQEPKRRGQINEKELIKIDLSRTYKVTFDQNVPVEQVVQELSFDPEIEYAEPNYIFKTQLVPNDPYYLDHYPDNVSNRDPNWNPPYDYQWNLKKINMEQAWDISTGSAEIKVAIIDTGIDYHHREFGECNLAQVISNNCIKIVPGYDFENGDDDPIDDNGHGTHVAGIIASLVNNGEGIASIAPGVRLMPVKVLDGGGSGTLENFVNGIYFAANKGASIFNMSLGYGPSPLESETEKQAFEYANNLGIVLIASAGNQNSNLSKGFWPANDSRVVAVAATDQNDVLAFFSNYGDKIDVSAPGGGDDRNIISPVSALYNGDLSLVVGNNFARFRGTSMASPHVVGFAALLKSLHPDWSNEQVKRTMRLTSDNINHLNMDHYNEVGFGRINIARGLLINRSIGSIGFPGGKNSTVNSIGEYKIPILGTATSIRGEDLGLVRYSLSYGLGENPSTWSSDNISYPTEGNSRFVERGILGYLAIGNLADGVYSIKLKVFLSGIEESEYSESIKLVIDRNSVFINQIGFPRKYVDITSFGISPLVADLNNDGLTELIVNTVVDGMGFPYQKWQEQDNVVSKISFSERLKASADLNNDGKKEIVTLVNNSQRLWYRIYGYDGEIISEIETQDSPSNIGIAKKKNEEYVIILSGLKDLVTNFLEVLDKSGRVLWRKDFQQSQRNSNSAMVLGDLDGDGEEDIIAVLSDKLYAWRLDGTGVYSADGIIKTDIYSSLLRLGDLDTDGKMEIILSDTGKNKLQVLDNKGSLIWEKTNSSYRGLSLGDLDNDGKLEIVAPSSNRLNVFRFNGNGFFNSEDNIFAQVCDSGFECDVGEAVISDINNDQNAEVIISASGIDKLFIFKTVDNNKDGEADRENGFPVSIPMGQRGDWVPVPAVADLDNDGDVEISVGAKDGMLYSLDLRAFYNSELNYWPQYLHDERHTGSYPTAIFPSVTPTLTPTVSPIATLIPSPTTIVTINPTITPTIKPTATLTRAPSLTPTPTRKPTLAPTKTPVPTKTPTKTPTPTPKPARIQGRLYYDQLSSFFRSSEMEIFGPVGFRMDYYDPYQQKFIIGGASQLCTDKCSPVCKSLYGNGSYSTPNVKAGKGYQLRLVLSNSAWQVSEAYLSTGIACVRNRLGGVNAAGLGTYLVNVYGLDLTAGEIKNIWFGVKPKQ